MLAAQAAANDPWANGILGRIPKMLAASAPPSPLSAAGSRGILGALANLQPAPSAAPADAAYLPGWRPFLPPDPIGYQGGNPSYSYLRNDLPTRTGPTGFEPDQSPTDETFGATPDTGREDASPNVLPVGGSEEDKEHNKPDPAVFGGLTGTGQTTPPTALPASPPLLQFFPRSLPTTSVPQPSSRASLPPPSSPPPGALSPPSLGQAANSPRPNAGPIAQVPADVILNQLEGKTLEELFGKVGPGPYAPPNGGVPLASPYGRGTAAERAQNNANGAEFGCHTCGTKDFGTRSGNPILDHQPPQSLNPPPGVSAQGYPQCATCSSQQGSLISRILRGLGFQ
jgi:hypothetical protein